MKESLRPIGVLVVVFLFGAVTGGAVVYARWQQQKVADIQSAPRGGLGGPRHGPPGRFMPPPVDARVDMLSERLGLSAEQRTAVTKIMQQHHQEREKITVELMAPLEKSREKMDADIRAVLSGEQKKKFDELLSHRPKFGPLPWMGPGGPHGPGHPFRGGPSGGGGPPGFPPGDPHGPPPPPGEPLP